MYCAFGDFLDLNAEVNFCLREGLELVGKVDEGEEELQVAGIVMAWMCWGVCLLAGEGEVGSLL